MRMASCLLLLLPVFTHLYHSRIYVTGCLSTLNMCVCFAAKFDVSVMERNCFHIRSTSAAGSFFSALLTAVCMCVCLAQLDVSAESLRFACGLMMRCMCGRHSYSAGKDVAFDWHIDWTRALLPTRNFAHYLDCVLIFPTHKKLLKISSKNCLNYCKIEIKTFVQWKRLF